MRLQKYMAHCGIASRRSSEKLIAEGRVTINGVKVREQGIKIDPLQDQVAVDGKPVHKALAKKYFMFHKPQGVLTTVADPHGRQTIYDILKDIDDTYVPVGRLDMDTEGLLFLTNDGDFTYRMTHPKFKVKKTYVATIRGVIGNKDLKNLEQGVLLDDGLTAPAEVRCLRRYSHKSVVEIVIHEGKKRQVRRMFEKVGHPVMHLKRTAIDKVKLSHVDLGEVRELTESERKKLLARLNLPVI